MRDDLLLYYERELDYLRKSGEEFAEKYPKVASRLVLERTKCEARMSSGCSRPLLFSQRAFTSKWRTSFRR